MTDMCGPLFWVLVVLAVVAVIAYFDRVIDLRRARVDYEDFLKGVFNVLDSGSDAEALAICTDSSTPIAAIVATAIRHKNGTDRILREAVDSQGRAEIGRLDRRMAILAIIGQVAPVLGLLGTIIGFIKVVLAVNMQTVVLRADLLSALMEALLSAAMGLAIAIPVMIMYGSLRVRLDRIVVELEAAASQIVGYLSTLKEKELSK